MIKYQYIKEVVILSEFSDREKVNLKKQITQLNTNFNDIDFIKLFHKLNSLIKLGHFLSIESWLLELAITVPIAKGLLALIYLELQDWDKAMNLAGECKVRFAGTDIWSDIIQTAIWRQFKEPRDTLPT